MIETNYDYESGHFEGTIVEQDALAYLGVFKTVEDVPDRYYLSNFVPDVDSESAWNKFDAEELRGLSAHTRRYVYGTGWRRWKSYCEENGVHPALPDPADVDEHLSEQKEEVDSLKTVHDARFRPLFRWFRWLQFHVDYPHCYNPVVMAVLLGGATYEIWETRLYDRKYTPEKDDA